MLNFTNKNKIKNFFLLETIWDSNELIVNTGEKNIYSKEKQKNLFRSITNFFAIYILSCYTE